jgi:hypothetical protein
LAEDLCATCRRKLYAKLAEWREGR